MRPYRTNFTPAVFPCHQTSSHRRRVPAKSNANSKWEGMAASPCTTILAPFRETSDTMQGRSAQPCFTSLAWIWRERRASRGIRFMDGRMPQHTSRWLREREEGTMGRRRHAYHRAVRPLMRLSVAGTPLAPTQMDARAQPRRATSKADPSSFILLPFS
jgi:hypothetical protein